MTEEGEGEVELCEDHEAAMSAEPDRRCRWEGGSTVLYAACFPHHGKASKENDGAVAISDRHVCQDISGEVLDRGKNFGNPGTVHEANKVSVITTVGNNETSAPRTLLTAGT